jgi:hypothetical protein
MLDETLVDLVNRRIDGEATPEELQELDLIRAENEEVDAYFIETLALCELLESVPMKDPPARLVEGVAKQISGGVRDTSRPLTFESRSGARRRNVAWLAGGVAAALLLAVALAPAVMRRVDPSQTSGTMTLPESALEPFVTTAAASMPGVSGSVRATPRGGEIVVAIGLASGAEGEIRIEFDAGALRLVSREEAFVVERKGREGSVVLRAPPWSGREVRFVRQSAAGTVIRVTVLAGDDQEMLTLALPPTGK